MPRDVLRSHRLILRPFGFADASHLYTPAELAVADTSRPRSDDLWPGDDLKFVLDRDDRAAGRRRLPNGSGSG